jgi:hypothetical protein
MNSSRVILPFRRLDENHIIADSVPISSSGALLSSENGILTMLACDISYGHPALYVQRTRFIESVSSRAHFPDHVSVHG